MLVSVIAAFSKDGSVSFFSLIIEDLRCVHVVVKISHLTFQGQVPQPVHINVFKQRKDTSNVLLLQHNLFADSLASDHQHALQWLTSGHNNTSMCKYWFALYYKCNIALASLFSNLLKSVLRLFCEDFLLLDEPRATNIVW